MRHPSSATSFDWNEHNEEKLAERKVYPVDVETVWASDPEYLRNKSSGTASWLMTGLDGVGRRLQIAILWVDEDEGVLRAIAGWRVD